MSPATHFLGILSIKISTVLCKRALIIHVAYDDLRVVGTLSGKAVMSKLFSSLFSKVIFLTIELIAAA